MASVAFVRPELARMRHIYTTVADALEGGPRVKSKAELYLPSPVPMDGSDEARHRYHGYRTRAVFYNVTSRTLKGLLGQLYARDPEVNVPGYLQNTVDDMDGLGVSLIQQSKGVSGEIIGYGRGGLFSDFPTLPDGQEATAADLQTGKIKPTITHYEAHQIINWRYYRDNGTKKLQFVILEEKREIYRQGEYAFTRARVWRVLRLDDSGYYCQEIYHEMGGAPVYGTVYPKDFYGNYLTEIPFEFIGSENNDPDIDESPLYPIADVNMAHYRNSADFEDSCFFVGQPTIAIIGLNQGWLDKNLSGEIRMGSRVAIPLPAGADIKLVQADPNNLAKEGMIHKEAQMVALGAKLVELNRVRKTATEAVQDETAESSVLQTIADNTSTAYRNALRNAGRFVSGADTKPEFKINTSFEIATLDAPTRAETVKEWQMGAITFEEMRQVLRRGGIATLDDKTAKAQIDEETAVRAAALAAADPAQVNLPGDTGATGATGANG